MTTDRPRHRSEGDGDRPASGEWQAELAELDRRHRAARGMGGPEAVDRFKRRGKLTARERVTALLDADSFRELGILAGKGAYGPGGDLESVTPSNHVMGLGRIDGRRAVVVADDATIRGGSLDASVTEKWIYAERYAYEYKLPIVRLVDTAGGSVKSLEHLGHTYVPGSPLQPRVALLGLVPVVGVALGACAGLGALRVALSHFSVMIRGMSQLFAAGPPVVKQALSQDIDKEALGGYKVHRASGVVNTAVETEEEAFAVVRRFLSYMPTNVWEPPPRLPSDDDPRRQDAWLNDAIPHNRRAPFDPRKILRSIFDTASVFEMSREYGGSTITALARLDGFGVGVITNDPAVMGGALTRAAALKMARFVDLCDTFHLPIVHLQDQPGVMVGLEAERQGTFAAALTASAAVEQSSVPWISIVIRRCFGVAGGMVSPWSGPSGTALPHRFGWPSARWGSIPVEGGVAAAYKREIEEAADPEAKRLEIEAYFHKLGSPYRTAERFGVVDVIEPSTTRSLLCDWVEDAYRHTARTLGPKGRPMR